MSGEAPTSDPIQADLHAWVHQGDQRRGQRALEAIAKQWRPRIARLLDHPTADEVDDALHDAIEQRCLRRAHGTCPALAPDGASGVAWQMQVLKRFLIDRGRKTSRRQHAVLAFGKGLEPQVEAQHWKNKKERGQHTLLEHPSPPPQADRRPTAYLDPRRKGCRVPRRVT